MFVCSLDLASLLQKPAGREELENLKPASSQGLGHSLVFTNTHHQPTRNGGTATGTTSYAHATLVRHWKQEIGAFRSVLSATDKNP